jgi:hypothetical protein
MSGDPDGRRRRRDRIVPAVPDLRPLVIASERMAGPGPRPSMTGGAVRQGRAGGRRRDGGRRRGGRAD